MVAIKNALAQTQTIKGGNMLGLIGRVLFYLAGILTGVFFSREEDNFAIMQMVAVMVIVLGVMLGISYWPWRKGE